MDTIEIIVTEIDTVANEGGHITINQEQARILRSALSGLATLSLTSEQQAALIESFSEDTAQINEITTQTLQDIANGLGTPPSEYDVDTATQAREELTAKIKEATQPTQLLDAAIRIGLHIATL